MKKLVLIIVLFLLLLITFAYCRQHENNKTTKINVSGNATVNAPADQIKINLSVINTGKFSESAIKENAEKMNLLIKSLKDVGLTDKEIKTSDYNLSPNWTPKTENPDKNWIPEIISYTVSNTLSIKTEKLELTGKIIETVVGKGANKIDFINYDLSKPESYKSEAIKQAIANAKNYAKAIEEATGMKIEEILEINLSEPYLQIVSSNYAEKMNKLMIGASGAGNSETSNIPEIVKGNVTISASVSIAYLAQADKKSKED